MIKACIFDCDGTLLDTLVSIASNANKALKDYGFQEIPTEEYKHMVGDGARVLIQRCLRRAGDLECLQFEPVYQRYREYFKEGCLYRVIPYEGIQDLIEELKTRGIRRAVLSNKPHEQTLSVISATFDEGDFDVVLGLKKDGKKKPDPAGALEIAGILGVKPEECLYIGDTDTDMQTGNGAGMHTVGVLWGFRDREELEKNHGEFIVERPCEIGKIAERLEG